MKVCLIIPPSAFLMDERVFPSLGALKVATSLERAGHKVSVLDLSAVANYEEVVTDYVTAHPETQRYGITATSPQMPAAQRIAARLPGPMAMLGGPHATLVHAAARTERKGGFTGRARRSLQALSSGFQIVAGDGENAVHRALCDYPWDVDADDPGNDLFLTSQAFASSGWPARHLVDLPSYHYYVDGERATSVISQLGCPMKCAFCAGRNSPMLRRMRLRPPEDVVAEMLSIHADYGIRGFMFFDDELNISRSMPELMRQLAAAGTWRLRGFLKAELFTEEQAAAMYAAGFRQLLIGFEAAHPRILETIQKNATIEENTRAIGIAHKHGLQVKALMSCGHPGETEETIFAIRDWLLAVNPADFDLTIITPYPGCPYYDEAVLFEPGVHRYTSPKTGDWLWMRDVDFTREAQYYKGTPGQYVSHVWTDALTPESIVALRDQVEEEVRTKLGIPFPQAGAVIRYEHSMGAGGSFLPPHILRSS
jgi:anaerobic magnesium-protoporphyrin IX monomethyl ester cyclase